MGFNQFEFDDTRLVEDFSQSEITNPDDPLFDGRTNTTVVTQISPSPSPLPPPPSPSATPIVQESSACPPNFFQCGTGPVSTRRTPTGEVREDLSQCCDASIYGYCCANEQGLYQCSTTPCYIPPPPPPVSPSPIPPPVTPLVLPPVECLPRGTILSSTCSGDCTQTVERADGNCGTTVQSVKNIDCCPPCDTRQYTCVEGSTNSITLTGARDAVSFECITQVNVNDPRCLPPPVSAPAPEEQCFPTAYPCDVRNPNKCCTGICLGTPQAGNLYAGVCAPPPEPVSPTPSPFVPPTQTPIIPSQTPRPTPTTTPVYTPLPSVEVYVEPSPSRTPVPSVTPSTSFVPSPTPTPSPIRWRSCIDGVLRDGNPPSSYRSTIYPGAGGGLCWEPAGDVGFEPSLQETLVFTYQRGSKELPQPRTITAVNPSYAIAYSVTMETNPNVIIEPRLFRLGPRGSQKIVINVTPELLAQLGDGSSILDLNISIKQE